MASVYGGTEIHVFKLRELALTWSETKSSFILAKHKYAKDYIFLFYANCTGLFSLEWFNRFNLVSYQDLIKHGEATLLKS